MKFLRSDTFFFRNSRAARATAKSNHCVNLWETSEIHFSSSQYDCAVKMERLTCSLRQLLGREVPEQSAELWSSSSRELVTTAAEDRDGYTR